MREVFHSARGPGEMAGMVHGNRAGGLLFLSAIRGNDPATPRSFNPDITVQAHHAFKNLQQLLEGAPATLDHLDKVTVYMRDLADRTPFHEVWKQYFPERPPARLVIQVPDADTVPGRGARFALDVIAVDPAAGR